MAAVVASVTEVLRAQHFLRLIHGDATNNYLVLAVVAWMRTAGSTFDAGVFASQILSGSIYKPSAFEIEREWTDPRRVATARSFAIALAAARRGDAGAGGDFLLALIDAGEVTASVLKSYVSFTGLSLPQPKTAATSRQASTPLPAEPRSLRAPGRAVPYLSGFAVGGFYAERHAQADDPVAY